MASCGYFALNPTVRGLFLLCNPHWSYGRLQTASASSRNLHPPYLRAQSTEAVSRHSSLGSHLCRRVREMGPEMVLCSSGPPRAWSPAPAGAATLAHQRPQHRLSSRRRTQLSRSGAAGVPGTPRCGWGSGRWTPSLPPGGGCRWRVCVTK